MARARWQAFALEAIARLAQHCDNVKPANATCKMYIVHVSIICVKGAGLLIIYFLNPSEFFCGI